MNIKSLLLAALGIITSAYIVYWIAAIRRVRAKYAAEPSGGEPQTGESQPPGPLHIAIGFVACFFDTLGISSNSSTRSASVRSPVHQGC